MGKIEYIASKLENLSPEFLNSKKVLPDGTTMTFEKYCYSIIANSMDENYKIPGSINNLENIILEQELDTGISPKIIPIDLPSLKTKKGDITYKVKKKYKDNLNKVVNFGNANSTLGELIDEYTKHMDDDGNIKRNGQTMSMEEIIFALNQQAEKFYNLVLHEKMRVRATAETLFTIEELAVSINPNFDMENLYVRFYFEYLEKFLNRCSSLEEMQDLGKRAINKLSPTCENVRTKANDMISEYIRREMLYNETIEEFNKGMGLTA